MLASSTGPFGASARVVATVLLWAASAHAGGDAGADILEDETQVMTAPTFHGEYIGRGAECPQFRLDSGEQVSLEAADLSDVTPGTRLWVTGEFARISRCMQGRAIIVEDIRHATPP